MACPDPSTRRPSCCAPSASARPIGCCTCTRASAVAWARSPRACGACARASAAGSSRSAGSGSCCTRGGGSCTRSPRRRRCTPTPRLRERRRARARHRGVRGGAAPVRLRRAQRARLQPPLPRAGAARRRAGGGHPRRGARLPAQAPARRGLPARAGLVRRLRRPRAPRGLLRPRPAGSSARGARRAPSRSSPPPTPSCSRRWPARWPRAPGASDRALRQADRAITETLEHHAHVRLRRVA